MHLLDSCSILIAYVWVKYRILNCISYHEIKKYIHVISTVSPSIDFLTKKDPRWSALKRNAQQGSLFGNGCVQGSSRLRANDPMPSYPSLSYMEPFSLIVEVKSPRVWDVICSTLVLYRSTLGLDRGVGVFKGDYTQRQGWLYWRSFPVTLILYPNRFTFKFQILST